MSRKSVAGVILLLLILTTASVAVAAEKYENVFIAGVDAGLIGGTGWLGKNFSPSAGGAVFFGYGITNNFAAEIDYIPLMMSKPKGDDVKFLKDAYWGGLGQKYSGMGGIGFSGKLYPRERFRDADFVTVQPFARMGFGYMPFIWSYKTVSKNYNNEESDGFNNFYLNFGGGCDFMLAKWVSLGLDVRLWKFFVTGDTLKGYKTNAQYKVVEGDTASYKEAFFKKDYEGSFVYNLGLNVTFQW